MGFFLNFVGGMQQASAAGAVAKQNAIIQEQNAHTQADALRAQGEITREQAAQNFKYRQAEAVQSSHNADALRDQARAQEAIDAINLHKRREAGQKIVAGQRARFAAAGLVDSTGSPLSILAETVGLIEKDVGEQKYANELAMTGLLGKAHLERLGGTFALAGATLDKNSSLAEASLKDASATATLLTGKRSAELTRMEGRAKATGLRLGAFGNLLSDGAKYFD